MEIKTPQQTIDSLAAKLGNIELRERAPEPWPRHKYIDRNGVIKEWSARIGYDGANSRFEILRTLATG